MKLIILLLSLIMSSPVAYAHEAKIKGYNDKNSNYISTCDGKHYGYHKHNNNNHWHEVSYKDGIWQIVNQKELKTNPCENNKKIEVKLKRCVDGDTVVFDISGNEEKYRFLAVDTPESVHPTKDVQLYAKEASKNTCDLLTNASKVFVEYDPNSDKTDKYGRNLVWVWIDDYLLQELMISEGYARVSYIYGNYKYVDKLCSLQQNAISSNKGIWQYGYEVGYCESTNNTNNIEDNSNVYTVSFKDVSNVTDVTVAQGMKVKPLKEEGRFAHYFIGWYHNNKKYNFDNEINSNIVLEARYKVDYIYIIIVVLVIISGASVGVKGNKNGKNHKKSIKHY